MADNIRTFHFNSEMLLGKVNCRDQRKIRIPLAAARTSDPSDCLEGAGCHQVRKPPRLLGKRRRFGDNGDEHSGTDGRSAGAPEAAGPTRYGFSAMQHFDKGCFQVDVSPGVPICGQKSRTHHDMMLWSVHVAKRLFHHLVNNLERVPGFFLETQTDDKIHPGSMALVADIVSIDAARLAVFLLMADGALHELILFQILKRRFAYDTFFVRHLSQ